MREGSYSTYCNCIMTYCIIVLIDVQSIKRSLSIRLTSHCDVITDLGEWPTSHTRLHLCMYSDELCIRPLIIGQTSDYNQPITAA